MTFVLFETYVKLSTSNRIWNIRSIRVWALCQTSFSGYPVPLRAFELLNLVNSQPFSLIYRRRFLCLSSALLLACFFSQRLFAWPLWLRPDRLITTKLPGEINPLFLSYVKSFGLAFESYVKLSTHRFISDLWGFETYAKLNTSKILAYPRFCSIWFETYAKRNTFKPHSAKRIDLAAVWDLCKMRYLQTRLVGELTSEIVWDPCKTKYLHS